MEESLPWKSPLIEFIKHYKVRKTNKYLKRCIFVEIKGNWVHFVYLKYLELKPSLKFIIILYIYQ